MKNGLTMLLLFFLSENAKNLGQSDNTKRSKKKRMALQVENYVVRFAQIKPNGVVSDAT